MFNSRVAKEERDAKGLSGAIAAPLMGLNSDGGLPPKTRPTLAPKLTRSSSSCPRTSPAPPSTDNRVSSSHVG